MDAGIPFLPSFHGGAGAEGVGEGGPKDARPIICAAKPAEVFGLPFTYVHRTARRRIQI